MDCSLKTGIGFDVHKLVKDRRLILGGVTIDYELGLEGHSDADVLLHAICDALLGAASLGDMGRHFPDTKEEYKDIDSLKLLSRTKDMLLENSFEIINVDTIIIAQNPKLYPYYNEMKKNIADCLELKIDQVNVKSTTTEKLGFIGKGEGIGAWAAVLVIKE
jgi:2-C-methyl-D-erythritol 2,4-cyclodiphosphate synthase